MHPSVYLSISLNLKGTWGQYAGFPFVTPKFAAWGYKCSVSKGSAKQGPPMNAMSMSIYI